MTEALFIDLLQKTVFLILMVSAPVLAVSLGVGLLISILQAITQIQESTLTFVPKIIASLFTLILVSPWLVDQLVSHAAEMLTLVIELSKPVN